MVFCQLRVFLILLVRNAIVLSTGARTLLICVTFVSSLQLISLEVFEAVNEGLGESLSSVFVSCVMAGQHRYIRSWSGLYILYGG